MTWNNLHFKPPVMKDRIIDGKATDLVLIRFAGKPDTTFAGFILVRNSDPHAYHICGRGYKEHAVITSQIEWMEVPQ